MKAWWEMWREWCHEHPATASWIFLVSILNLILNVIQVVLK